MRREAEVDAFFNADPPPHFSIGGFDSDAWEWVERFQVVREPPLRLGVMFGDCVQNLRSALDHLAWQVTLLDGGTPGDSTQFPIASKYSKPRWTAGDDQAEQAYQEARQNGGTAKVEAGLGAVTKALTPHADPVVAVVRYGIARDAALVIRLRSGAELAFQPQTDLLRFDRVREQAMLAGLPLEKLTHKTWTAAVVDQALKAAAVLDDATRRDELVSQSRTFLLRVLGVQVHPFVDSDPASRYEAFRVMQNHFIAADGFTPAYARSIALLDTVMSLVLPIWWLVSVAKGDPNEVLALCCAIFGLTFSTSVAVLARRS
jgi:hypothetical protein